MSGQCYSLSGVIQGVWNPEDMVRLPGTSWIVASGMRSVRHPGRLFVVDSARQTRMDELRWEAAAEPARLGLDLFDPHGMAARQLDHTRFELLVVDHGGGEAIDRLILELRGDGPVAVHGERLVQPPQTSADALSYLPGGDLLMTSFFDPTDPETRSRFARAEKTGRVWRWSPRDGWSPFGDQPMSGANGIAVSPDGASVTVCEWAARRVWRFDANGVPVAHCEVDFLPDNLRWTSDGRLLLAGQSAPAETLLGWEQRGERPPLAFKVVRLDPATFEVEPLIAADETHAAQMGFGGATGALEVGKAIWVGSFTGEQIGVFSPAGL